MASQAKRSAVWAVETERIPGGLRTLIGGRAVGATKTRVERDRTKYRRVGKRPPQGDE